MSTATSDLATKLDAPYIVLSMQSETNYIEHDDDAKGMPLELESTDNNAADDEAYGASNGTLQKVEATHRAQKAATTAFNAQFANGPNHKGAHAIQEGSQHTKPAAARKSNVRYVLSGSDDYYNSRQEFEQIRNDGGFQLTKYLASPKSDEANGVKNALRAHRKSSSLRDNETLQNLYREQLAQGATTTEALSLIERTKGSSGALGKALSDKCDMSQLRISKYASLSKTGKAIERHERGQLTSTKFAR